MQRTRITLAPCPCLAYSEVVGVSPDVQPRYDADIMLAFPPSLSLGLHGTAPSTVPPSPPRRSRPRP